MAKPVRMLKENVSTVRDLEKVLKKERRIVLVFHATWCVPCRLYEKIIDKYRTEHDVPLSHVNVENARELTEKFQVMSVPFTLIVDEDMSVKETLCGNVDEKSFHNLVIKYFSEAS